jgi:hypothetical protein
MVEIAMLVVALLQVGIAAIEVLWRFMRARMNRESAGSGGGATPRS